MEGQNEEYKPKLREARTCSIFLIFFSLGFYEQGTIGPSLLDLVMLFKTDTKTVGIIFMVSNISGIVGCIISGIIIDRYNQELIVAICSFLAGVAFGGMPWIPNIVAFIIAFGILKGLASGIINTDWNDYNVSNISQTSSVSGGIGNTKNVTQQNTDVVTHVQYGFLVIGGLMILIGFFPLTVFFLAKPTLKALPLSKSATDTKQNEDRGFRIRMLVLVFFYLIFYCGTESVFGNLIATFVVKSLRWDKYKGPLITSVFWGVFGVSRIVAIPVSIYCHPRIMTLASLLTMFASLLTMIFSSHIHEGILWTASSVLGFAMGPIFPTAVVWISKYIVVTGPTSAVFLIGASIASASFPPLVAYLIDLGHYEWMLYLLSVFCCLCFIIFLMMHIYARRHGEIDHAALQTQTVDERMIDVSKTAKVNDNVKAHHRNEMDSMLQSSVAV